MRCSPRLVWTLRRSACRGGGVQSALCGSRRRVWVLVQRTGAERGLNLRCAAHHARPLWLDYLKIPPISRTCLGKVGKVGCRCGVGLAGVLVCWFCVVG